MAAFIYKILRPREYQAFCDGYKGTELDRRDGFIHFSTAEQLEGTLAVHFRDSDEVVLLEIASAALDPGKLRFEPSRKGEVFPHFYGPLPLSAVVGTTTLRRGGDGRFLRCGS